MQPHKCQWQWSPPKNGDHPKFFAVAVENPAVFHAFMAKTRCDYDAYVGQREVQIPSSEVLYHRGKALNSLSKQLTNSTVGYESVIAVTLLKTIDVSQTQTWILESKPCAAGNQI